MNLIASKIGEGLLTMFLSVFAFLYVFDLAIKFFKKNVND